MTLNYNFGFASPQKKRSIMFWRRKRPERGLKALAEGGLAFARTYSNILAQTESQLEDAIQRENRKPKSTIGKVRMKGEKVIHSKQVLLCIVLLNILDCILVLGELILDIYYLKGVLEKAEHNELNFVIHMKQIYPDYLAPLQTTDISDLYRAVLDAKIEWGQGSHNSRVTDTSHGTGSNALTTTTMVPNDIHNATTLSYNATTLSNHGTTMSYSTTTIPYNGTTLSDNSTTPIVRRKRAATSGSHGNTIYGNGSAHHEHHEHGHSIEEDIAHGFHKASIAILAILVVETMMKVLFLGKELLERKLEMFDGFIVVASFIVDIVFLKGMSGMHVREMVVILAFLVPHSLVVAVIDHEHFRMKLLYKQKKAVSTDLKKAKAENKSLTAALEMVKKLAVGAGLSADDIDKRLAFISVGVGAKKKKSSSISSFHHGLGSSKKKNSSSVSSELKLSVASIQENVEDDVFAKDDKKDQNTNSRV
ncbi:uncharacterized protein LOC132554200 [Ylistrum balloti]|uniref:uncharacterized protein LOC132554200 n=1 Tax=Ylistrum balloti TaxID=509963 RepID=UPI002905B581|nr:uncharacterized protein LOC132554200 [Ylistrum balloti]